MNLPQEFYFAEPRFAMTTAGRAFVRLSVKIGYGLWVALIFGFLLSDLPLLRSIALLMALFLAHRFFHRGRPDRDLRQALPVRLNIAEYLSPESYRALEFAFERAPLLGTDFSLLLAQELLHNKEVRVALLRLDVSPKEFESKVHERAVKLGGMTQNRSDISRIVYDLSRAAFQHAAASRGEYIEPHDIFAALGAFQGEHLTSLFQMFQINQTDLSAVLLGSHLRRRISGSRLSSLTRRGMAPKRAHISHHTMNRSWSARATPFLDRFGSDLTDLARAGQISPLIGHKAEYDHLVNVLSRPGNPNVLLVGDSGSGKDPVVKELARAIAYDQVPAPLFDRRLVSISIAGVVAGSKEGELESRLENILADIKSSANIIIYIPDIHLLVNTSGVQRLSAADVFVPAIKQGLFPVIGATFPKDFKQHLEGKSELLGRFEVIRLEEMSEADALKYLMLSSVTLEIEYGIVISMKAIKEAVVLAKKYLRTKLLPESAEDLLREAIVDIIRDHRRSLSADDIALVAERMVKIPIHKAAEEEKNSLLHLEEIIHERFVDQEEAVKAVSQALREYRAGLSRKGGPAASFLFVGPTGVGKTELAKLLAEIQFGSASAMLRFDMSEYQDKQSIFRLIGAPDGSVRGSLTDAVWQKPYSLILLDEFEKAHPDILNIFLQVFDDGRLTDSLDRVVDFQNTIIIATSNAHSDIINDALSHSESMAQISDYLKRRLVDVFKPELLNRFSSVIAFKNLGPADVRAIAKVHFTALQKSLLKEQGITLVFDDEVVAKIAQLGFDPMFGARPLRRVIDDKFRAELANMILKNELAEGYTVTVHSTEAGFTFSVTKPV